MLELTGCNSAQLIMNSVGWSSNLKSLLTLPLYNSRSRDRARQPRSTTFHFIQRGPRRTAHSISCRHPLVPSFPNQRGVDCFSDFSKLSLGLSWRSSQSKMRRYSDGERANPPTFNIMQTPAIARSPQRTRSFIASSSS